jgi:hypothetical protein
VDANIATTAIVSLVATDRALFPVAMVLAPLAVEAPVEMAAWTAIDSRADFIFIGCTMVASSTVWYCMFSVDLMVVTLCDIL